MKLKLAITCFCLVFPQLALSTDLTMSAYKRLTNSEAKSMIVEQLGIGMSWANASLSEHKIYCAPPNLALEADNYLRILDDEMRRKNYKEDDRIGMILLLGLQKTFPCK